MFYKRHLYTFVNFMTSLDFVCYGQGVSVLSPFVIFPGQCGWSLGLKLVTKVTILWGI